MRILFTLLTVLLLAVALGWWLQDSPGAVIFTYKEWIIQTSLVVFALVSGILFLVVYVLLRLLTKILHLPADLRRLSESRRRGLISAEQARAKQLTFQAGLLRQAGNGQDRAALKNAWRSIPNKLKKESSLIGAYVRERLRQGDSSDCEALLRRALKRQWDPELVRLYGLVEGRNLKRQLEFAGNWLSQFPRDAELLLTLGRLCKKNHLWGKARSYLEQSIHARPDPATCQELAILLEQQGEHAAARSYLQEGLNLATGAHETGETGTALVVSETDSTAAISERP